MANSQKIAIIWDAETGTRIGELKGLSMITSVCFSPDGTRIVTGSDDNLAIIWDAKTGNTIGEPLKGHT